MTPNQDEITFDVELRPGEPLSLPADCSQIIGPGHWKISIKPSGEGLPRAVRDHSAFLSGYAPEDEGLYDDYPTG